MADVTEFFDLTGIEVVKKKYYNAAKVAEVAAAAESAFAALQRAFDSDREKAARYAQVLYYQSLLIAGLTLEDPAAYAELVCSLME